MSGRRLFGFALSLAMGYMLGISLAEIDWKTGVILLVYVVAVDNAFKRGRAAA